RVYVSDEITSPCLFGLFHPAIYVTPEAAADKTRLRHVLIHENTHKRHLDPLWSLLRAVCLIVWFFDPLVWLAAYVSRIDGELACDEGALAVLGEDERIAYGETLLVLVPVRRTPSPMLASTSMASGKKRMRDRITRIAEHKKPLVIALAAVLVLAAVIGAACFMGRSNRVDVELHGLRWAQHDIYYTEPVDLEIHGTIRRRLFDYDLFYGTVTLGEIRQEYNGQMKLAIMPWEDENYKTGLLQAAGFYYDSAQGRMQPTGSMVFDSDYSKFLMFSIDTEHYYSFPAETREEALKIAQQTAGKMLMVFSESPDPDTLPEYLVVDESAEIDTALRQAYDLNAERVHFEPETLIDSLFLSPEYEMRGGNSVGYFGEPDGEYQDYLTLGDGKVGIASDESTDNYGWFAYFRDPMDGADPALRYQDFAAPRPFSDGTNVNSGNTDLSEPPSLTRRLAPFDKTALSFGSLDEARAEFSQVLASLGADGLGIRYGCAMDTETMNALGMHYKDALLPEDGDAFFFRIMQSYNGIPFLDVDWTAKRSSASDSEPRLQSATAGEAFINQNGLVRLSLSGIYNARTDGEAQRLISCAEALESVIAFYTPDPPEMPVHVQSALLCYVTTDIPEKGRTYRYIPAYVFDVWEYETREVDGETLQYATLNRFVIDAKTGARLSENGETE
ncbi:MAG: M56 family metallopeptidase, partial [Oscillospiraceae bacterium]|nr:M56 family metallopeptidase [Oscillospiraceae bacterium]